MLAILHFEDTSLKGKAHEKSIKDNFKLKVVKIFIVLCA